MLQPVGYVRGVVRTALTRARSAGVRALARIRPAADRQTGLQITVTHLPPGTSKWNKVEHRLFSQTTMNWRGRPLTSHEVVVETIAATTTTTGLRVHAVLDENSYPTGIRISDRDMRAAAEADGLDEDRARHRYEFLHATFGEYLIAAHVMRELHRLASAERPSARRSIDDELLFALLSHQPMALRADIIRLCAELFDTANPTRRRVVLRMLNNLIAGCRQRSGSGTFAAYHPVPVDHVRQLAAYSANLVLLRASLDDDGVALAALWPDGQADERWRSLVDLWRAGLDDDGWRAMLRALSRHSDIVRSGQPGASRTELPPDLAFADLVGADDLASTSSSTLTQLIRSTQLLDPVGAPLAFQFAQSQISRVAELLRDLVADGSATYEGEDRDWMLALTSNSAVSIDAASLTIVDTHRPGSDDDSLWTSDLGQRYLELHADAIQRGVRIRRVFITDLPDLAHEPPFEAIWRLQQDIGIDVRILDSTGVPSTRRSSLFDFILFDEAISYEVTPAAGIDASSRPTILNTRLELRSSRVQDRVDRFHDLWEAATVPRRP